MMKSSTTVTSRFVPYLTDAVLPEAVAYLPNGPAARLTARRVNRFVTGTALEPGVRMAVLGVLRAHASNAAEVGTSLTALMIAVLGFAFGLLNTVAEFSGWFALIPLLEVIAVVITVGFIVQAAVAAHIQKVTAVTWLGAYEDGLANEPSREPRGAWWRFRA
ncbi:hypothetical protein [Curtobacterium sp. USHLN213]|uniref:hypothetical protein n=1 Tax=Curtobacterium sp. USHLN213 TaxID=3081255 RepID=UPI00301A7BF2